MESNSSFAEDQRFSYPLLCDTERKICTAYEACESSDSQSATRMTYVIGEDGKILQAHKTVKANEHPKTLLTSL